MKVKWYGHASFLLISDSGLKIITDPYEPGGYNGAIAYGKIPDVADIVLVTHDHADHNYVEGLPGKPKIIKGRGPFTVQGVTIRGIPAFHDSVQGSQRGENTIFCFTLDDLRVCHLGDLGHIPSKAEAEKIGLVDVLFLPVGGFYTIDPSEATETAKRLTPKIVIPMHFKTPRCGFPLASVEEFTTGKKAVKAIKGSEIQIDKTSLPKNTEIVVLNPAL